MEEKAQYLKRILEDNIHKVVFTNVKNKEAEYRKIVILKKEKGMQIEKYTEKQVFHENIAEEELERYCMLYLEQGYMQMNAFGKKAEYSLRITKKDKVLFHKSAVKAKTVEITSHNRKKQYILEEGTIIPPLVDMGIFTKEGKVVASMYDKYRQINKFIEIVDDAIRKYQKDSIRIIDFGCGKSYLTFIMYYYLVEIKKMKVEITGLDLKEEVIKNCNETAKRYGYDHLKFELGDINGYKTEKTIDMVVSLHACDTATDYALYNAISWNAGIILSVPCCQHELAAQMSDKELPILSRYGIVKERTAALMTDAIRCNLLTYCGYKTQLLEFVDFNHTPKNLLIRAIRSKNMKEETKEKAKEEVEQITKTFSFEPTPFRLLLD